jgi:hypothetical protein
VINNAVLNKKAGDLKRERVKYSRTIKRTMRTIVIHAALVKEPSKNPRDRYTGKLAHSEQAETLPSL